MKTFLLPFVALAIVAVPMAANAAPCRDSHGRFIACAKPAAKPAAAKPAAAAKTAVAAKPATHVAKASVTPAKAPVQRCKLGNKFAKCGTPGAKPV